jgi:hypothetical protein
VHQPRRRFDRRFHRRVRRDAGTHTHAAQHRLDADEELHDPERLGDVVVGAGPEAAHLVDLLAARGEHDHRDVAAGGAHRGEHRVAVGVGQHQVEDHEVGRVGARGADALGPGVREPRLVPFDLEVHAQGECEIAFVLDDQDARHEPCPASDTTGGAGRSEAGVGAAASATTTRVPPSGASSIQTRPPIALTRSRTTASPIPVPCGPDVPAGASRTNAWNTRSRSAAGNARPLVVDDQPHLALACLRTHASGGAARGILHGVVEQVQHDLPQRRGLGEDVHVVRHVDRDPRRSSVGHRLEHGDRLAELAAERASRECDRRRRAAPREAQHALDEHGQPARLAVHDAREVSAFLGRPFAAVHQRLGERRHVGERRAQLVRHARDELRPQPRQLAPAAQLIERDGREHGRDRQQREQGGGRIGRRTAEESRRGQPRIHRGDHDERPLLRRQRIDGGHHVGVRRPPGEHRVPAGEQHAHGDVPDLRRRSGEGRWSSSVERSTASSSRVSPAAARASPYRVRGACASSRRTRYANAQGTPVDGVDHRPVRVGATERLRAWAGARRASDAPPAAPSPRRSRASRPRSAAGDQVDAKGEACRGADARAAARFAEGEEQLGTGRRRHVPRRASAQRDGDLLRDVVQRFLRAARVAPGRDRCIVAERAARRQPPGVFCPPRLEGEPRQQRDQREQDAAHHALGAPRGPAVAPCTTGPLRGRVGVAWSRHAAICAAPPAPRQRATAESV